MSVAEKIGLAHEAIKPKIGSRILNSKQELLSGELSGEIRDLLEARGVLVFPQVNFTDEEQIAFTQTLGKYAPEAADGSVTKITLDLKENPSSAEYLKGSLYWHIDGTRNDVPILASLLSPKVPSPKGTGNTGFCNTYAAYDDLTDEQKAATIKEFNFTRGILVATFSGIMSASFAYGLDAAAPIADLSAKQGTDVFWTGLPKLCVVLLGGFTTNFIWCVVLNVKNRTGYQYFSPTLRAEHGNGTGARVPMLRNYMFSALAGVVWYLQFFFYSMGETQMGAYKFSSWTLHMASIIIFSSLWGIALKEWAGSSRSTKRTLFLGLATLILSTIIVGYGNYLGVG